MITLRDITLFKKLQSYGMLSTKQVNEIVFNNIAQTTVLRRLRLLEDKKLIQKITGLSSMERLWALTERGAEIASVKLFKRHFAKGLLEHDFRLLSLRLKLEGIGIAHSWIPEHELRSKVYQKYGMREAKHHLIPDGLMGVDIEGKKESIAIELELTMKNESRYFKTFGRYFNLKSTYAVWYVVKTIGQVNQLFRLWRKWSHRNYGIKLYVSMLDPLMKDPQNAKVYSETIDKKMRDIFRINPAHPTALGVSTQLDKKIENKCDPTTENHAPILNVA